MPQFAHMEKLKHKSGTMATPTVIQKDNNEVPNFLGKTLKKSIQEAKHAGLSIEPVGSSGRVVWQSVSPGQLVHKNVICKIKLESM